MHFGSLRAPSIAVLVASFGVVACSAASDSSSDATGSVDEEIRIKPVGDEIMSTLTLQLPTGTCVPGGSCTRPLSTGPTLSLDGTPLTLGAPLRVRPGDHALMVGFTQQTITLTPAQSRVMTIPVVNKVCQNASATTLPPTDFGRLPSLRNAACPTAATLLGGTVGSSAAVDMYYDDGSCSSWNYLGTIQPAQDCNTLSTASVWGIRVNGVCSNIYDQSQISVCQRMRSGDCGSLGISSFNCAAPSFPTGNIAVVPGSYSFATETTSGPSTDTRVVNEGDAADLVFTLPIVGAVPARFNTNLTFADPRELPDAAPSGISSNCAERDYNIAPTASGTLALKAFAFPECSYRLNVPGRSIALSQSVDNNVTLHRIDVDDVLVTREDGTTFTKRGTYELYFGGSLVAGPYPTNSGIDALDGDYELVVKFTTGTGDKTNRYTIHF
jgi:hypothetical protein